MFINLTPHPMTIYPPNTPDHIEPGSVTPTLVVPASSVYPPTRLGESMLGTSFCHNGVTIEDVGFGPDGDQTTALPDPAPGTWYIVSLVVGLAARDRDDLLVPHAYVRDLAGSVIGSRMLARPARAVAVTSAVTSLAQEPYADRPGQP